MNYFLILNILRFMDFSAKHQVKERFSQNEFLIAAEN